MSTSTVVIVPIQTMPVSDDNCYLDLFKAQNDAFCATNPDFTLKAIINSQKHRIKRQALFSLFCVLSVLSMQHFSEQRVAG